MSDASFPYLSLLTGLPLVGALVVALLPRAKPGLARVGRARCGRSSCSVSASAMWIAFDADGPRFQLRESYPWIPTWDARFTFAVDGIALVMIALIVVFVPLVVLYSWNEAAGDTGTPAKRSVNAYFALLLALREHDDRRLRRRRRVPVLRLLRGHARPDVLPHRLLRRGPPAVRGGEVLPVLTRRRPVHARRRHRRCGCSAGTPSTGRRCVRSSSPTSAERWLFLGFFVAFAIKAPFFPFHTWLPDAGGAAPAGRGRPAGRRARQGGHVRHPALLPAAVPQRDEVLRPARAGPGADRHHLCRPARGRPERPQTAGVLHLGGPLRIHRHRHLRAAPRRPGPARCSTWSTTAWPPGCCSWSSA